MCLIPLAYVDQMVQRGGDRRVPFLMYHKPSLKSKIVRLTIMLWKRSFLDKLSSVKTDVTPAEPPAFYPAGSTRWVFVHIRPLAKIRYPAG